jgi:hypothetical protein
MIIALGGSCCSSCGSTRNSRDRCTVRARESLSVTAREVLIPQAVLSLMPVVSDSDSLNPDDSLRSWLREAVPGSSGTKLPRDAPRPRLRPVVRLAELDSDRDSDVPSVLV